MSYRLFLDDERMPPNDGQDWIIARTVAEAQRLILDRGFPAFVSFDNDLGEGEPEGYTLADWLVAHDLDTGTMPVDFAFYAHTQNPVRASYITATLNRYLDFRSSR